VEGWIEPERRRSPLSWRLALALALALGLTAWAGELALLRPGRLWTLLPALLAGHLAFGLSILLLRGSRGRRSSRPGPPWPCSTGRTAAGPWPSTPCSRWPRSCSSGPCP